MSNALIIVVGVVSNILSVVGVVICNKYITEVDGFHFVVFLSFLHFSFTSVFTRIMLAVNIFSYQSAPLDGILPVAAGSLLSVAFMNLNLQHNSVGFYQVYNTTVLACLSALVAAVTCVIHLCFCLLPIALQTGMYSIHLVRAVCGLQAVRQSTRADLADPHHIRRGLCHSV